MTATAIATGDRVRLRDRKPDDWTVYVVVGPCDHPPGTVAALRDGLTVRDPGRPGSTWCFTRDELVPA